MVAHAGPSPNRASTGVSRIFDPGEDVRGGPAADTLTVDPSTSFIRWTGTRFWGLGKSEGTIRISDGYLVREEGIPVAGVFTIDMHSIAAEGDTGADSPLATLLASEDFFATGRFPVATYRIVGARRASGGLVQLDGNLTLRGKSRPVHIDARIASNGNHDLVAHAPVQINRRNWGITYHGSVLKYEFIDNLVYLDVTLVARDVAATGSE